jgi:NSS family neurotransmitter:Na+ symporter
VANGPESPGKRAHWGTRLGFILAAAGSAVGLGNIWKFPYITGEYGGGAFVLVYLGCILLVGLPLMYSELIIGRRGGRDVLGAMRDLTAHRGIGARILSVFAGLMAVASGFFILSFYSVIAGWSIHFLVVTARLLPAADGGAGETFQALVDNPAMSTLWHTVFMAMVTVVVARGVHEGIERICSRLMPALVGILVALLVYVAFTGGLARSASFLFRPDFGKLSGEAVLEALGHAFFTLSLGMGAMVTYGSYLSRDVNVVRDGVAVAVLDTLIALLAGLVIFSVVFAHGLEPGAGPGLVFVTLPGLFTDMPGGVVVGIAFFFLLLFAAWSSGISLLEVVVAYFVDEHGFSRVRASWLFGGAIWVLGIGSAMSGGILDFFDNLTTRYMLPLGGLIIAIIAGWLLRRADRDAGFRALPSGEFLAASWTFLIRFVTPVLVLLVILTKMGVLRFGE